MWDLESTALKTEYNCVYFVSFQSFFFFSGAQRLVDITLPGFLQLAEYKLYIFCWCFQGRSYCVRTQRMLNQCLESLVQKVLSGVVINFEKTGPDPPPVGEGMNLGIGTAHWSYSVIK